ncbi:hypothetical protein ACFOLF_12175 [Paenibacillus sepulcri]|uniref:Uncharacterized protein n=1 Tax=Paenibacillus sepulcri TaxID=359917 RepID=A0ABS7BUU4_9BACL|nr:hypothetical protein [Paenibacillus sepulcri]
MPFIEEPPKWLAPGVEPSESKKTEGWLPNERPPADYWNWQMSRVYKVLLELQEKALENEDLATALGNVVKRSGDTMTGPLMFKDVNGDFLGALRFIESAFTFYHELRARIESESIDIVSSDSTNITAMGVNINASEGVYIEGGLFADRIKTVAPVAGNDVAIKATVDNAITVGKPQQSVMNGQFDIWQRGAIVPYANNFGGGNSAGYGPDRFWGQVFEGTGGTGSNTGFQFERTLFTRGQTDVPGEPSYFCRYFVNAVGTKAPSNAIIRVQQQIEDVLTYAGRKCTLSFYAKASTNRRIAAALTQQFGLNGSPDVPCPGGASFDLTTAWQKFSLTFTVPSIALKVVGSGNSLMMTFVIYKDDNDPIALPSGQVGTYATGSIDFSQIQLNEGDTPLAFRPRAVGEELALCQRYFEKSYSQPSKPGDVINNGAMVFVTADNANNGAAFGTTSFSVTKRTTPSVRIWGIQGNEGRVYDGDTDRVVDSGKVVDWVSDTNFRSEFTVAGAITSRRMFQWTADAEF